MDSSIDGINKLIENATNIPKRSFIDERAFKMMQKMGYKDGQGLGKKSQGVKTHLDISSKQDRRGLGFESHPILENVNWDISTDVIRVRQTAAFISSDLDTSYMTIEDLRPWAEFAPKMKNYPMEPKYCDPILQEEVLAGKGLLGDMNSELLRGTRSRANPFETVQNAIFLNRAALKMANIDAACNFMFTSLDKDENHSTTNKPYYFADVCAGPGGFSEYILWKKKWFYKGFGFTLQGKHDFQLNNFWAASPATFQALYGAKNNGDIYDPENIIDFRNKVLAQTDNQGVHFMMADGGFNVDGFENLQEVLSKKIYLCQCLVALSVVREKGHFVTKLFDTFTKFSAGLIYLMYRCFDEISIFKPNASRPANSERYLICKSRRKQTENIRDYFMFINNKLWTEPEQDIMSIVPENVIETDELFLQYLVNVNHSLCERQICSLKKLMIFYNDVSLREPRQIDVRVQCLQFWGVPNESRTAPVDIIPGEYINNLLPNSEMMVIKPGHIQTKDDLINNFSNLDEWNICLCNYNSQPNYKFYLACGGTRIYEFIQNNWQLAPFNIELPRGSLILAEEVQESNFALGKKSTISNCLHVIDAFQLGDLNISELDFQKRRSLINIFCEAVNQPYRNRTINIRSKPFLQLSSNLTIEAPTKLVQKKSKEKLASELPPMCNNRLVYFPGFILFLKNGDFVSSYSQRHYCQLIANFGDGITWNDMTTFKHSLS